MQGSIAAIICAAGSSSRMGGVKKEYLLLPEPGFLSEKPLTVLGAALSAFASSPRIGPIVITVPPDSENAVRDSLPPELCSGKRIFFVNGGPSRRASVFNALSFLITYAPSHVLIHDGARPWIKPELVEKIIDAVITFKAVIPALPLIETPKELKRKEAGTPQDEPDFIGRHLKRADICTAQTPQGFRFPEILKAHEKAAEREEVEYTDDAEVWGEFIGEVAVIPGDPENRKITYPEDIRGAT